MQILLYPKAASSRATCPPTTAGGGARQPRMSAAHAPLNCVEVRDRKLTILVEGRTELGSCLIELFGDHVLELPPNQARQVFPKEAVDRTFELHPTPVVIQVA